MELEELRGTMYPAWFTECANLLWFILDLDRNEILGTQQRADFRIVYIEWMGQVVSLYEKIKAESEAEVKAEVGSKSQESGQGQDTFILQMWSDALFRATETVLVQE